MLGRVFLIGAAVLLLGGGAVAAAWQIRSLSARLAVAEERLSSAEASLTMAEEANAGWAATVRRLEAAQREYRNAQIRAARERHRLDRAFGGDFEKAAKRHPKMVERAVNGGTARMLGLLDCASRPDCSIDSGTDTSTAGAAQPTAPSLAR